MFSCEERLKEHIKRHHKERNQPQSGDGELECELCGKQFAHRRKVKKHMLTVHEVDEVECPQCGETFQNQTKLKRHEIFMHAHKFQCEQCGEGFWEKKALADHEDVHREFKCEEQECDFKAKTVADLLHHMNQHYLASGQLWSIKRYIL